MNLKNNSSLVNPDRLSGLIQEAERELAEILPEIEYLQECLIKLEELKDKEHKLKSLIINLKTLSPSINSSLNINNVDTNTKKNKQEAQSVSKQHKISIDINKERKVFLPEVALSDVRKYLRTNNNINYEIYKAVVTNTGEATTENIKNYLIANKVKQPKTGKGFKEVPLKEISSRANYLVRKRLLISHSPGTFSTVFGWQELD